jgi:hypothetical protein
MNISGFRCHGLRGNPKRWSLGLTGNYRITFGWSGQDALEIDLEDYHWYIVSLKYKLLFLLKSFEILPSVDYGRGIDFRDALENPRFEFI